MLKKSTIQLLRFHFSYFLMPVFFFALSFEKELQWFNTLLAFILIHLLLYPSSNGYNSYMDKDTSSIGGVEEPLQPTYELYRVTVLMDAFGVLFSLLISLEFALCYSIYIIWSRLYSYRKIRLKKYPFLGYLVVIINQGALIFLMTHLAAGGSFSNVSTLGMISAAFLIGGFYPITQVYQHKADKADKVRTISMLLGVKNTFLFCAVMYLISFSVLFSYFQQTQQLSRFLVIQIFFIPVIVYFLYWTTSVFRNKTLADFKHTMRMNFIASTSTNLAFLTLIILNRFD